MTTSTATREADLTDFQQSYSDFHKEAYGFRPRHDTSRWTLDDWRQEFAGLAFVCEQNRIAEAKSETAAAIAVEKLIAETIARGAKDRATALRWLHDAHGTGGDDQYLCYELGLRYGYFS